MIDKIDVRLMKRGTSVVTQVFIDKINELIEEANKDGSKAVVQSKARGKQGNKPKDGANL